MMKRFGKLTAEEQLAVKRAMIWTQVKSIKQLNAYWFYKDGNNQWQWSKRKAQI